MTIHSKLSTNKAHGPSIAMFGQTPVGSVNVDSLSIQEIDSASYSQAKVIGDLFSQFASQGWEHDLEPSHGDVAQRLFPDLLGLVVQCPSVDLFNKALDAAMVRGNPHHVEPDTPMLVIHQSQSERSCFTGKRATLHESPATVPSYVLVQAFERTGECLEMTGANLAVLTYFKHRVYDRIAQLAVVVSLGVPVHRCNLCRTVERPNHRLVALCLSHTSGFYSSPRPEGNA